MPSKRVKRESIPAHVELPQQNGSDAELYARKPARNEEEIIAAITRRSGIDKGIVRAVVRLYGEEIGADLVNHGRARLFGGMFNVSAKPMAMKQEGRKYFNGARVPEGADPDEVFPPDSYTLSHSYRMRVDPGLQCLRNARVWGDASWDVPVTARTLGRLRDLAYAEGLRPSHLRWPERPAGMSVGEYFAALGVNIDEWESAPGENGEEYYVR